MRYPEGREFVLIFARTGRSHEQAVIALREALSEADPGVSVRAVDLADLLPGGKALPKLYSILCRRLPWLYAWIFHITNNRATRRAVSIIAPRLLSTRIVATVGVHPTAILVLHPMFVSETLIAIRQRLGLPWLVHPIVLDLGNPHEGWYHSASDMTYCFSLRAKERAVRANPTGSIFFGFDFPARADNPPISQGLNVVRDGTEASASQVLIAGLIPFRCLLQDVRAVPASTPLLVIAETSRLEARILERLRPGAHVVSGVSHEKLKELIERAAVVRGKAGPMMLVGALRLGRSFELTREVGPQERGNAAISTDPTWRKAISAGSVAGLAASLLRTPSAAGA